MVRKGKIFMLGDENRGQAHHNLSHTPLNIPPVIEEDLFHFHEKTYGIPFTKSVLFPWDQSPCSSKDGKLVEELDDPLGYYSDGVKRTLTDDQIAMFRHSEIHSLLRQQAAAKIRDEEQKRDFSSPKRNGTQSHSGGSISASARSLPVATTASSVQSENDEEEEYRKFLATEREQLISIDDCTRESRPKHNYPHDRTISTRRLVRELDDANDVLSTLDYGDGDATSKMLDIGDSTEGRKIWWPELRP